MLLARCLGEPGLAAGELGERGEGADPVFTCGGNVGA